MTFTYNEALAAILLHQNLSEADKGRKVDAGPAKGGVCGKMRGHIILVDKSLLESRKAKNKSKDFKISKIRIADRPEAKI